MTLYTTETVAGKEIEVISAVKGAVVYSKHVGRDFMAGLKTLVGGELEGYTEMLNDAREIATQRMITEASRLGGDCVVGLRYSSSAIMDGAAEVLAYGTAAKIKS